MRWRSTSLPFGALHPTAEYTAPSESAVDAEAMTALLYDFARRADYRAAVKREFDGIRALFDEYVAALEKLYRKPVVRNPGKR